MKDDSIKNMIPERIHIPYSARTPLGRRLLEIRERIIASGELLLNWEEIEQEVAKWRGETEKAKCY